MSMKLMSTLAATGLLALAIPVLADDTTPTQTPTAQQQCRTERTQMGTTTFKQTYGTNHNRSNAFGKCVSKRTTATENNAAEAHTNASQQCRTEQAADPAAFDTKYGTNGNCHNAFGKCVSQTARALTTESTNQDVAADVKAAKACRTERTADPAAFKTKYGTNHNGRNAFGRCVSQKAKAQPSS
jgi:hypothetical protein